MSRSEKMLGVMIALLALLLAGIVLSAPLRHAVAQLLAQLD